jgi:hypothetical protein
MEDRLKISMFWAACAFILICLAYCFVCIWNEPKIDLTTPIIALITGMVGYYWGSSKSSADKTKAILGDGDDITKA